MPDIARLIKGEHVNPTRRTFNDLLINGFLHFANDTRGYLSSVVRAKFRPPSSSSANYARPTFSFGAKRKIIFPDDKRGTRESERVRESSPVAASKRGSERYFPAKWTILSRRILQLNREKRKFPELRWLRS